MRTQFNDQLSNELLNELMEEIEEERHQPSVTGLIKCLTRTYFDSISENKLPMTTQTKVFFFVGLGLEKALLVKRKEMPLSGKTDGVFWHVDSFDDGRLIELKSTRAGKKRHLEEGFGFNWESQMKSYCKALGVAEVDLAVVYLIQADFQVYHIKFGQEEIDEHWEWMLQRKEVFDEAKKSGEAPTSFAYNQDWECKDCQYKLICDTRVSLGVNPTPRIQL